MFTNIVVFLIGACWGSFLNVLAFRLLHELDWISKRSFCPYCQTTLHWHDLIPVFSYLVLKGTCRTCKHRISWLYPFIELLTAILAVLLWNYIDYSYLIAYSIFFSALIVTIRTDLEAFVIFRVMTWSVIPFGFAASILGYLPISFIESILGIISGYLILWLVQRLYRYFAGQEGIGDGDLDLLATIGAFCGPVGVWTSLTIGSTIGLISGLILIATTQKKLNLRKVQIPFGPFLAAGAIIYVFLPHMAQKILLGL